MPPNIIIPLILRKIDIVLLVYKFIHCKVTDAYRSQDSFMYNRDNKTYEIAIQKKNNQK